jgi:hypothetical protein
MENCIGFNPDIQKPACAKNSPKAPRGAPREGQKIQKAQIHPSKTSFDRENDTDYEYNYLLAFGVGSRSRNLKNS